MIGIKKERKLSTRDNILNAIAANKPSCIPLPEINPEREEEKEVLLQQFKKTALIAGARLSEVTGVENILHDIEAEVKLGKRVIDARQGGANALLQAKASELATVDIAIIDGSVGVAENGAIWVSSREVINPLLPFISQHLIIVLKQRDIVDTMHSAYEKIGSGMPAFGVFIAGPSKTADIEQSLVIGAHGAVSLTIYLLE